jgi:preprotein translocase subunit SecA
MQSIVSFIANFSRKRILNRYKTLIPAIRRRQEATRASNPSEITAALLSAPELNIVDACANVLVACDQLKGGAFPVMDESVIWNILPFDSQILGGLVLFNNQIAEMATGEGKTLSAVFAAYLSFLSKRKVHIVTANEYLAQRDAMWMKPVFDKLGCSVGLIVPKQTVEERKAAYRADVLYSTSSGLIFDYLGDNGLVTSSAERLQQGRDFAIVDEADSVLIDEARTPIIISGNKQSDLSIYAKLHKPVKEIHKLQAKYVDQLVKDLTEIINSGNLEHPDLGKKCYLLQQADPNNEQLQVWLQEANTRSKAEKFQAATDGNPIETAKLHNQGYYAIGIKDNSIHLSDACQEQLSKYVGKPLVIPDMAEQICLLEHANLSPEEKRRRQEQLSLEVDAIATQLNAIQQLIKAYALFRRDIEYIVRESRIVLIDMNTGRLLPNRHLPDGLHQALELKEHLTMSPESQVLAETSIQNYFRQYKCLSGMTGTASIDADEFLNTYKLDVITIPPHKKCIRQYHPDLLFKNLNTKMDKILADIQAIHAQGRPILVGTSSVQESELVSAKLKALGLKHTVLNAKNHAKEATIIAQAGQKDAITIATSMAGRGTDIKLSHESVELGGLHIIGTTRYFLRRLDEQLLGRCARQGDPGSIQFYISLEDDLLKESKAPVARYLRFFSDDNGIQNLLLDKVIADSQAKFAGYYHASRKQLVSFDNVVSAQRLKVFAMRNAIIDEAMSIEQVLLEHLTELKEEEKSGLEWFKRTFPISFKKEPVDTPEALVEVYKEAIDEYAAQIGFEKKSFDRVILIGNLDESWREYITYLDSVKDASHLMGYAQIDPISDFSNKAAKMYIKFIQQFRSSVFKRIFPTLLSLREQQQRGRR